MTYQKLEGDRMGRIFAIPQADVHPGRAVIAIRLYAPAQPPEFLATPALFNAGPIPLAGTWSAKAEYALPALTPDELAKVPVSPGATGGMTGSFIYNGVVHPIIPYGLAGVLWYQGESNVGTGYQYRTSLPLLINDLRSHWGVADLPFYICQLPCFLPKQPQPSESPWADLRESQTMALSLPNTAEAVLIDQGEAGDIHPRDKVPVGDRLARIALARQYGQKIVYAGPYYQSMTVEDSRIRVKFTNTDGGLLAKPLPATYRVRMVVNQTAPLAPNSPGSEVEGFAICGDDKKFVWADAKIDGDSVVVWSDQVPHPTAVRYAWADNPTCNLYNGAGLPAAPFRTDTFPVITQFNRFGLPAARN
jgi:sialate O-acetylesterase